MSSGKLGPRSDLPPVLVLADHFGYPGGVPHGVTSYLLNVLPRLAQARLSLTACFLRGPHAAADALGDQGIEPVFLDAGKWDPTVALRVASLARRRGARLVHATGIKGSLAARVAARLAGARVLLHVHDLNDPGDALSALQRMLSRPSDAGVCVSEAVRGLALGRYHLPAARVRVVPNGIPLEALAAAGGERAAMRRELSLGDDPLVLAVIGRLHPVKGHRGLIAVLPRILRGCPQALLLVAGDGPERGACEALARQLGVAARVRFLGPRRDIPRLLAASDLVLMPSKSEGLGLAAIEALAAGRPVIAFAVGGLTEVVTDRVDGRLVPAGDMGAFVQAVLEIACDRQRRTAQASPRLRPSPLHGCRAGPPLGRTRRPAW
jgi:glycosyltransferase involved in cell wall biosynthesis